MVQDLKQDKARTTSQKPKGRSCTEEELWLHFLSLFIQEKLHANYEKKEEEEGQRNAISDGSCFNMTFLEGKQSQTSILRYTGRRRAESFIFWNGTLRHSYSRPEKWKRPPPFVGFGVPLVLGSTRFEPHKPLLTFQGKAKPRHTGEWNFELLVSYFPFGMQIRNVGLKHKVARLIFSKL